MSNFWDEKYNSDDFLYGTEPNEFIKEQLSKLKPGKILFPAEGEGRNVVWAAKKGWNTTAFDLSIKGKEKAELLAQKNEVSINYLLKGYGEVQFEPNYFDVIALCFTHMPPVLRKRMHQLYFNWLKPGGHLIIEGFSKEQLNYNSGGPKDLDFLFSENELQLDFEQASFINIQQVEAVLNEGFGHKGKASLINGIITK